MGARLPTAVLAVLALLQAVLLAVSGHGVTRVVAVALALVALNVRLRTLQALTLLILVNLGVHIAELSSPIPYRLWHVALLAAYAAVALASLGSMLPRVRYGLALGTSGVLAMAFTTGEAIVGRFAPSVLSQSAVTWSGTPQVDALPPPYGVRRSVYPDNPRHYFDEPLAPNDVAGTRTGPSVTYTLNALGCRGGDYAIPNPHTRSRVVVLGGDNTLGVGVHEADTFPARLEQSLNTSAQSSGGRGVEVINCGVAGTGTRDQRLFHERLTSRYEPDLVLLTMSDRDNLSRQQEAEQGYVHQPAKVEDLFFSARLLQWARHEGRRPFEYSSVVDDVLKLDQTCRTHGSRLAVAFFRHTDIDARWTGLMNAVTTATRGNDIPVRDLGVSLLSGHAARELVVHPVDPGPNDVAHHAAAIELEKFLRTDRLLN